MILLTDISFFQKPLEIVNLYETDSIAAEVSRFIRMYEPKLLQDVLGYELYSTLQAALLVNPLTDTFQKLLFGDAYTYNGRLTRWRGIIDKDDNNFTFGRNAAAYRNPEWLEVGVTTDSNSNIIIPNNATSFTIPSWIGWEPILFRFGVGPEQKGTDYNYDITTGTVSNATNAYQPNERLFVQFQLQSSSATTNAAGYKHSFIADYIYFHYQRSNATFSTGIGEKKIATASTTDASAGDKMIAAWNEMSQWITDMWCYLEANKAIFPDWYGIGYKQLRDYKKINPYF